jgi:Fe-S cluster assembly scaffold protein SufB
MNTNSILDKERDLDLFESVTEEEIIYLWRSIKGRGISEDEAWHAVVTGLALDMAFAKTKAYKQIEH